MRARYASEELAMNALHSYVRPTLRKFCDLARYALDEGGIKSLASVAEKLESGRYRRWSALDDLVRFTVVVPTVGHDDRVVRFLNSTFARSTVRGRGTASKAPDVFRFDSTRWYGRVRRDEPLPDLEERAFTILFEVQVKTAFEHAWSIVTHDVVYKGDDVDWNKLRLAAQLKALVEQMDTMVEHFELVASKVPKSGHPETDAMTEIIVDLKLLIADGLVDDTLTPESWTRLARNLLSAVELSGVTGGRQVARLLSTVVKEFGSAVRDGTFSIALSGSLYQAVIAHAASAGLSISELPLVPSAELTEFYAVTPVVGISLDA